MALTCDDDRLADRGRVVGRSLYVRRHLTLVGRKEVTRCNRDRQVSHHAERQRDDRSEYRDCNTRLAGDPGDLGLHRVAAATRSLIVDEGEEGNKFITNI